jgi:hypothetical protein
VQKFHRRGDFAWRTPGSRCFTDHNVD